MILIADCENHLIDYVITKSLSRFSRNTTDFLELVRRLKTLNIPIYKELESKVADLVKRHELFFQSHYTDRTVVDNPVVTEIIENDRRISAFRRRHILGDNNRLTENSVVIAVPQIVSSTIL